MADTTIVERIQEALRNHLYNCGCESRSYPKWLYVGDKEARELDKEFGGILLQLWDMDVVMVYRDTFLEVG